MLNLIFVFVVAGVVVMIVTSVLMALWVEDITVKTKAIKWDIQYLKDKQDRDHNIFSTRLNTIEHDVVKIHEEVLQQRALLEENIIEVEDE